MKKSPLPPSRTADQFVVRFPDGMRDRITIEAKANNRSMNAEIIARLEGSISSKPHQTLQAIEAQSRLIQSLGGYVATLAEMVVSGESASSELLTLLIGLGKSLRGGDLNQGCNIAEAMVEFGVAQGDLDPSELLRIRAIRS
jgi:hypothetical protein